MPHKKPENLNSAGPDIVQASYALRGFLMQNQSAYGLTLGGVENLVGTFESCLKNRLHTGDPRAVLNALNDAAAECRFSGMGLDHLTEDAQGALSHVIKTPDLAPVVVGVRQRMDGGLMVRVGHGKDLSGLTPADTVRPTAPAVYTTDEEEQDDDERQTRDMGNIKPFAVASRPTTPFPAGYELSQVKPKAEPARPTVELSEIAARPSTPWSRREPDLRGGSEAELRRKEAQGRRVQVAGALGLAIVVGTTAMMAAVRRKTPAQNPEIGVADAGVDATVQMIENDPPAVASAVVAENQADSGVEPIPSASASGTAKKVLPIVRKPKKELPFPGN